MSISVVIIAFKSDHILPNLISKIPNHHEIIVIENSLQNKTKTILENKYNNLKVLIPNENLGYSGGVNLGVEKSKNNFVLIVTADVDFTKEMIENFEECIENFNDFALLAPVYKNDSIHKNFKVFNNKRINEINIKKFQLSEVDEIDGALFLINKKQFDSNKIMDDKFFLYYDSTDLCHNLKKKDKKLFIVKNLKFTHKGTSSSNKNYEFEISINRNWHYSWSKFYFFKKNYNYLYALKKVLPNLFRSLIMYLYFKLISDKKKAKLNKAIISGIANAILLRKSFYRPNIK